MRRPPAPWPLPWYALAGPSGELSAVPEIQVFLRKITSPPGRSALTASRENLELMLGGSLSWTCALKSLGLLSLGEVLPPDQGDIWLWLR